MLHTTLEAIKNDSNLISSLTFNMPAGCELYFIYYGGANIEYYFIFNGTILFSGNDYRPGAFNCVDSIESMFGLIGLICMQPGDTDSGYFAKYTPEQMAWCATVERERLELLSYSFDAYGVIGIEKHFTFTNY